MQGPEQPGQGQESKPEPEKALTGFLLQPGELHRGMMLRVPLLRPHSPMVGTGIELQAARDSGYVVLSETDGEVVSVQGNRIQVVSNESEQVYELHRFRRSNQSTCLDQRPIVHTGDVVRKGDVLADSLSTKNGRLALGQNVLCAFISWEGANYEDAIIISEELVREDNFTSVHIEKHETESRETKLGPEEITRDIPNVGEDVLRDLDGDGIVEVFDLLALLCSWGDCP